MTQPPRPNIETKEGQAQLRQLGVTPLPQPDDLTAPYWDAARKHELHIQRCTNCAEYQHPPFAYCRQCNSGDLDWTRISGRGHIYSFIIDHRLMVPGFSEPYVVAQVNPIESPSDLVRITTNIRDCALEDVYIGMPVEVLFEDVRSDTTLPQFKPLRAS